MKMISKMKMGFLLLTGIFTLNLEANPMLARQYDMACSACHSQVPALNDMGLSFLRNGLRTSSFDPTALKSALDSNSTKRFIPIGAMVGISESSKRDTTNVVTKLYMTGSLTESMSLWAASKESFNPDKEDQRLFESGNSQLYLQYNIGEAKHAIRAGLMSTLTQLGNVRRSMAHSGLHGGEGHGLNYFSPLDHSRAGTIKGIEYSYLTDDNILLLASFGEVVNNQDEHGNLVFDEGNAFLAGVTYKTESNYKIGLIYNNTEVKGDTYYSFILPLEKEFTSLIWNSSLVYANDSYNDYIGLENALTFPMGDMEHIKVIFNVDNDEFDNNNYGYSLGYTKIYDMFFFEVVGSRVITDAYNSNKLMGSIQLIF